MWFTALALMSIASADCMSGNLSVWPAAGTELPASGQLVVQAYGSDRPKLSKARSYALVSGDQRVDLKIGNRLHGSFSDDQQLLTPRNPVPPGKWTLEMAGEPLVLWTGKAHEAVSWTFSAPDPEPPTWAGAPSVAKKDRQFFGCGPGVSVVVEVPTRDTVWMEVEVDSDSDEPVKVWLPVQEGKITIGHGMCSGLIELEMDRTYTVELTPIGADGRRGKTAAALEFVAP